MDHQKSYLSTIQEIRARLEEENAQLILTSHGSKSEDLDDATAKLLQDRNMRRMHAETVAFERKQARNPSRYNVVQASPSEFSLHWQTMTLLQKDKALEDFVDCEFASLTASQRETVTSDLKRGIRRGDAINCRICWNGYFIDRIHGLKVAAKKMKKGSSGGKEDEMTLTPSSAPAVMTDDPCDDLVMVDGHGSEDFGKSAATTPNNSYTKKKNGGQNNEEDSTIRAEDVVTVKYLRTEPKSTTGRRNAGRKKTDSSFSALRSRVQREQQRFLVSDRDLDTDPLDPTCAAQFY